MEVRGSVVEALCRCYAGVMQVLHGVVNMSFLSKTPRGPPCEKVPKFFGKIYAVVIVHNKKKVEKFLTRLMLNLQEIQTFGE